MEKPSSPKMFHSHPQVQIYKQWGTSCPHCCSQNLEVGVFCKEEHIVLGQELQKFLNKYIKFKLIESHPSSKTFLQPSDPFHVVLKSKELHGPNQVKEYP